MIPKVIHYCWFGRNPKPELVQNCIASWKKFCPDYEIIEWNEDNFDVNYCKFTEEAYKAKKWVFVADVARLVAVYENGGIYLDTDVELKSSLDDLLQYDAWFAQLDIRYIHTGLGFGAVKGNDILKELIDARRLISFDGIACHVIETPIIKNFLNYKLSRNSQIIQNVLIIGMDNYGAYAKHWESNSWMDNDTKVILAHRRQKSRLWKIKRFLRNPSVMSYLERNGETKVSNIYIFLVYDFLDNGPRYYIKRLAKKVRNKING